MIIILLIVLILLGNSFNFCGRHGRQKIWKSFVLLYWRNIVVNLFLVLRHRVFNLHIFNILIYEQTRTCLASKMQLIGLSLKKWLICSQLFNCKFLLHGVSFVVAANVTSIFLGKFCIVKERTKYEMKWKELKQRINWTIWLRDCNNPTV